MYLSNEVPGEGVRLKRFAEAGSTTRALDEGVEVSTSGVASSVGASGIGASALEASATGGVLMIEMPGLEASFIRRLPGREISGAAATMNRDAGVRWNFPSTTALMMGFSKC